MVKVLVVCHGNICRSPLFSKILSDNGIEVRQSALKSYNNDNWRSEKASGKIVYNSKELYGIDLSEHRSRKFDVSDIEWCDYCVYFDNGNLKRLMNIDNSIGDKCKLINAGELLSLKRIPDPNFLPKDSEEVVNIVKLIYDSANEFIRRVSNE